MTILFTVQRGIGNIIHAPPSTPCFQSGFGCSLPAPFQLVLEIQRVPACLILSGIGWTLMIPSGFALAHSKSNELLSQGLTIIGPLMFGFGVMGV